jgi:hypothetical protein
VEQRRDYSHDRGAARTEPDVPAPDPGNGYELKIVGYQTTDPEWTAGGAVDWKYDSAQAAKRMNELLGLRSIFLNWWFREWLAQGGSLQRGAEQVAGELIVELLNRRP